MQKLSYDRRPSFADGTHGRPPFTLTTRYPDFKPLPCPTAPKVKKPNPSGPGHHQGGQGPALLQAFHCNITFAIQTCCTTLHIATVPSVYPIASQHTDTAQQFCCHNFCIRNTNLPYNFAYCTIQILDHRFASISPGV